MKIAVRFLYFTGLVLTLSLTAHGQVRLPKLVSDGMVLQRNAKVNIWGWASSGEKVTVRFKGKNYHATTGQDGKWLIALNPSKAGGPFSMEISGANKITINNILMGDVWFARASRTWYYRWKG